MSNSQLRCEIEANQRLALRNRRDFESHLDGLTPHDRLVAEAYVAKLVMQTCLNARLDHAVHLRVNGPSEGEGPQIPAPLPPRSPVLQTAH